MCHWQILLAGQRFRRIMAQVSRFLIKEIAEIQNITGSYPLQRCCESQLVPIQNFVNWQHYQIKRHNPKSLQAHCKIYNALKTA